MHTRRSPSTSGTPNDWEHSKFAIQEFGGWIKNADTKATILAASFGLSLTFAAPRLLDRLPDLVTVPLAFGLWIAIASILGVAALITGYGIGQALLPRTSTGASPTNRFAWPSLARSFATHVPPAEASADEIRTEAWEQAASLARVAAAKYRSFRTALIAFCVYIAALIGLVVTQTVVALLP